MSITQETSRELRRHILLKITYILDNFWLTIPLFAIIGIIFSFLDLTMSKEVWSLFFSSIAQIFAAIVSIVAVFFIFRLEMYNNKIDNIESLIIEIQKSDNPKYKNIAVRNLLIENNKKKINYLKQIMEKDKNKMKFLFEYSFPIIMLSIFLIPLGSVSTGNNLILAIWDYSLLKWAFVYSIVGFCVFNLYRISVILGIFLSEKD